MPDYRAYIVGIDGHFNNSLAATTLSFGTATDSWVDYPRKRSKAASVGGLVHFGAEAG
jgi:hypothetical protein